MTEQPLMVFKTKEEATKVAQEKSQYLKDHVLTCIYEVENGVVIRFVPK